MRLPASLPFGSFFTALITPKSIGLARAVAVWLTAFALMAYGLFMMFPTIRLIIGLGFSAISPYMFVFLLGAAFGVVVSFMGLLVALWELFHLAFRRTSDSSARHGRFLALWFGFNGRLSLGRFWACAAALWWLPASWVFGMVGMIAFETASETVKDIVVRAWLLYGVLVLWTWCAVGTKRCHDRNRGAPFLLLGLIPLCNIWLCIELHFMSGTIGPNEYGPDPRDRPAT